MTAVQEFLRVTSESIGSRLVAHRFAPEPIEQNLNKVRNFYWVREAGWRNEAVRLFYHHSHHDAFYLDLGVYLPIVGREEGTGSTPLGILFHSANLQLLVDRKKPYYFPRFFGRPRTARADSFAAKIGRDVERSLDWFLEYRRPEECLKKLDSGETHWGHARGDAYRALSAHLRQVSASKQGAEGS